MSSRCCASIHACPRMPPSFPLFLLCIQGTEHQQVKPAPVPAFHIGTQGHAHSGGPASPDEADWLVHVRVPRVPGCPLWWSPSGCRFSERGRRTGTVERDSDSGWLAADAADEQGGPWTCVVLATNGRTNKWRSFPSLGEADSQQEARTGLVVHQAGWQDDIRTGLLGLEGLGLGILV